MVKFNLGNYAHYIELENWGSTCFTSFFFHYLNLAIRFKITTGYRRVSLPRMLVYISYIWSFIAQNTRILFHKSHL